MDGWVHSVSRTRVCITESVNAAINTVICYIALLVLHRRVHAEAFSKNNASASKAVSVYTCTALTLLSTGSAHSLL